VDFLIIFNNSGEAVGYLIVVSQALVKVSVDLFDAPTDSWFGQPYFWGSVVFWTIIAPLSALRDYSRLKWSSSVGVVALLYLTGITLAYALIPRAKPCPDVVGPSNCGGEVLRFNDNFVSVFTAIPIVTLGFLISDSSFLVYNDLRDTSMSRVVNFVNTPVVLTAAAIFITTALSAYFTFGDTIEGNFILNYPASDIPVAVGYVAIAIIATAGSPLKLHPSRASLLSLLYFTLSKATGDNPLTWWGGAFPTAMLYVMTLLNLVLVFVLGLVLDDLGLVFALVGAIAGTGLSFYLPGFYFFKLFESDEKALTEAEKLRRARGDTEKGPAPGSVELPKMIFRPFWLRFHRDAALVLGFTGFALSIICVVALVIEYQLLS
jgi:amino acid permease